MADQVALGLIGCGGNMGGHVRGYANLWEAGLRDFRVAAVCDVVREKADGLAARLEEFQGTRPAVYGDFRRMLDEQPSIEACDISVVHSEHHKVAVPCLQSGRHVIIEKPLAITCRAARSIIEAAEKASRLLQTAENYRRSPENRAINWALRQGRIGAIRSLYWLAVRERLWYWGWREHRELAGGGWTMDGGVHFADLFRYHVGEIATLFALSKAYFPTRFRDRENMADPVEVSVEDTTHAVLDFENGASGVWLECNVAHGAGFGHRALYGSQGSLRWGDGLELRTGQRTSIEELVRQHHEAIGPEGRERLFPRGLTDTIASELWEFIQAIRGNAAIETDGLEGLKALAIAMGVYESAALGQPVRVAKVESCEIEKYQADLNEAAGL